MKGRKPKPTHLKVLAGNPGKRALNRREPQPRPASNDQPPAHLSDEAKGVWARVAPELRRLQLLDSLSTEALAGFCDAYARWIVATAEIRKTGEVVKAPSGYPVQNPWRAIANKAFDQWTRMAAEFGMTPSSKSRVSTANTEPINDEERFFGAG